MSFILDEFTELGRKASFHFAAEYPNEDSLAYSAVNSAMQLYRNNPHLREDMTELSKKFLWASMFVRKQQHLEDLE